jgi:hypothetical protein
MANKVWTTQEFETLLIHNNLSDDAMAAQLSGRTAGAVAATRDAAHVYHTGGHPTFHLAQSLQDWLAARPGRFRCPRCGEPL